MSSDLILEILSKRTDIPLETITKLISEAEALGYHLQRRRTIQEPPRQQQGLTSFALGEK